ncbi:hypothetical protein [Oscillatoria sp. FACHB-1406]|uniref:DUF6930 domain-containing protein n=1 Tax=Oscillatoria sp. FACHB-1406 TaxID=2692846 RepID=UPI00168604D1|nr:hypothetical protein [Oscillatoria sp. FACHB-1406]MBD2579938.1 hypothetical protein [Oscillatoria sp. FACHB-1406]
MNSLHPSTLRRLKKISQIPSVWEGDRRPLGGMARELDPDAADENGDCIIWVDGSEGLVRAMDVVSLEMGPEAVVRTLLRAIENPHSPARPARPQKIVVRDREIHFFLRGTLQDLDIDIDYVPELPLIDELFRGFEQMGNDRPPHLPPKFAKSLQQAASELWKLAPWEFLGDHQIISICLNRWDIENLYVSVMGMLGQEYGVLLYRSLESLERFRAAAIAERSPERLEKAFLSQDCWFVNYSTDADDFDESEDDLADWPLEEIYPIFGSVHPYEGMRPFLDEEEAIAVYAAVKALTSFIQAKRKLLAREPGETLPTASKRCRIALPPECENPQTLSIEVSTLPELSAQFLEAMELEELNFDEEEDDDDDEGSSLDVPIQDDLIPADALVSLTILPWEKVEPIRADRQKYYPSPSAKSSGETVGKGLPVAIVQTSRPKVKKIVAVLAANDGLKGICLNPGEDPFTDTLYELGLLQAENGNIYLFKEFLAEEPDYLKARQEWEQALQVTKGCCGLILAMGAKGTSRGNPRPKDLLALFETKVLSAEELGTGVLQLMPQFGFELDW